MVLHAFKLCKYYNFEYIIFQLAFFSHFFANVCKRAPMKIEKNPMDTYPRFHVISYGYIYFIKTPITFCYSPQLF